MRGLVQWFQGEAGDVEVQSGGSRICHPCSGVSGEFWLVTELVSIHSPADHYPIQSRQSSHSGLYDIFHICHEKEQLHPNGGDCPVHLFSGGIHYPDLCRNLSPWTQLGFLLESVAMARALSNTQSRENEDFNEYSEYQKN